MTAGNYDFIIEQGSELSLPLIWKGGNGVPIDLTGCSAEMMIRREVDDSVPLVSLSSADGGIVLGETAGTIAIAIDEATTSELASGKAYYDLRLTDSLGKHRRLIQGQVIISPAVTR